MRLPTRHIRNTGLLFAPVVFGIVMARTAFAQTISSAYTVLGPSDTLTVPFTSSTGIKTTDVFSGPVEIQVSGTGEAYFANVSDAFYYTATKTETSAANGDFELAIGTPAHPFVGESDGQAGKTDAIKYDITFINGVGSVSAGTIPAFSSASTYDFVINVPNATATQLTFGVNDGDYADNTGSYTIRVTQLATGAASAPEPNSAVVVVGFALPAIAAGGARFRKVSGRRGVW